MQRSRRARLTCLALVLGAVFGAYAEDCSARGFVQSGHATGRDSWFIASVNGLSCRLERDGISFSWIDGSAKTAAGGIASRWGSDVLTVDQVKALPPTSGYTVRLSFLGASPQTRPYGLGARPEYVNIYRGRNPKGWQERRTVFEAVIYESLWPGVDLLIHESAGGFQYELRADDPAALDQVRYRWEGSAEPPAEKGRYETVNTPFGALMILPRLGTAARGIVRMSAANSPSSWSGPHAAMPARMDPDVVWSTYMGGEGADCARDMAVDSQSRLFIGGDSNSDDFPTTPGVFQQEHALGEDAVLMAWEGATGQLLWSTYLGGDSLEEGWAVCLSAAGNPIIAGRTWSTDFPTTPGVIDTLKDSGEAAFIAELDAGTGQLLWSTLLEGAHACAAATTAEGAVVIAGVSYRGGAPTTAGAFDRAYNGDTRDGLLARISQQGQQLDWCTYLGSENYEFIMGLDLDFDGCPVVAGWAGSSSLCVSGFPVTAGAYDATYNCAFDGIVAKMTEDGSNLVWGTFIGGQYGDYLHDIAVNDDNNVIVVGYSNSQEYPTTIGSYQTTMRGEDDAVVSVISSDGSSLVWSTFIGGLEYDSCWGIDTDNHGRVLVSGRTFSRLFPGPNGPDELSTLGETDGFLAVLRADGSGLLDSHLLGGSGREEDALVTAGPSGVPFLVGRTESLDFPTTAGCFQDSMSAYVDLFVLRMSPVAVPVFLQHFSACRTKQGALVRWELAAGDDPMLLRLWREAADGQRWALAQWEGVPQEVGEYVDQAASAEGASYWLEASSGGDKGSWYGPATLAPIEVPQQLQLSSGYPNPFNPRTAISYGLPQSTHVNLAVYDQRGRRVRTLVNSVVAAGEQVVEWDGRDDRGQLVASGTYVARLVTEQGIRTSKLTLAK